MEDWYHSVTIHYIDWYHSFSFSFLLIALSKLVQQGYSWGYFEAHFKFVNHLVVAFRSQTVQRIIVHCNYVCCQGMKPMMTLLLYCTHCRAAGVSRVAEPCQLVCCCDLLLSAAVLLAHTSPHPHLHSGCMGQGLLCICLWII